MTGDTIYIKTQAFRLLRYYSPAPRKIARSDWATQNITHNMTSTLKQPYGVHSHKLCFINKKGNFNYGLHKPHKQKELQGITHHYIWYSNHLFIYFILQKIMDVMMTWSQTFTDSHKQEMVFLCTALYRTHKSQLHNNDCDQN